VKLTAEQQRYLAKKAQWYFDVYMGRQTGDSCVYTGDGVDDLDRLEALMSGTNPPDSRFMCDVGKQYSDWRPFDIQDVQAVRTYYIGFYGTVAKPPITS
jgi:hypothetical protein